MWVVPNTGTFTEKRPPCAGEDVQEERTDVALGATAASDERRVGRLEAVALQGPPARESDPGSGAPMASQAEALPRDAIEATRRRRRVDGVWAARLTPSTRR